jgi:hypothetical protein
MKKLPRCMCLAVYGNIEVDIAPGSSMGMFLAVVNRICTCGFYDQVGVQKGRRKQIEKESR